MTESAPVGSFSRCSKPARCSGSARPLQAISSSERLRAVSEKRVSESIYRSGQPLAETESVRALSREGSDDLASPPFGRHSSPLLRRKSTRRGSYISVPTADQEGALHQQDCSNQGLSGKLHEHGKQLLQNIWFQASMAFLIVANSLVIGFETDCPDLHVWNVLENFFLVAFALELGFRLSVLGAREFFSFVNPDVLWNLFDFVVVLIGLVDVFAGFFLGTNSGGMALLFRIIRLLRILRIFRIVRFLKQLYLLAFGLAEAAQAVFWVTVLMTFVLYVCAIILVRTVGNPDEGDPHQDFLHSRFGGIPRAMLTLFELMASPNLPEYQAQPGLLWKRPTLTFFLVSFVIFGSFGMIALLTGVISESMFEKNQLRIEEERLEKERTHAAILSKCADMFDEMEADANGEVTEAEIYAMLPALTEMLEGTGVDYIKDDLEAVVNFMDSDFSGKISKEEFCRAIIPIAEGVRAISVQELHYNVNTTKAKLDKIERMSQDVSFIKDRMGMFDKIIHLIVEHKASTALSKDCVHSTLLSFETKLGQILNKANDIIMAESSMLSSMQDLDARIRESTMSTIQIHSDGISRLEEAIMQQRRGFATAGLEEIHFTKAATKIDSNTEPLQVACDVQSGEGARGRQMCQNTRKCNLGTSAGTSINRSASEPLCGRKSGQTAVSSQDLRLQELSNLRAKTRRVQYDADICTLSDCSILKQEMQLQTKKMSDITQLVDRVARALDVLENARVSETTLQQNWEPNLWQEKS